ncbi:MAG: hypothetical protein KatS3mg082_1455 [Nitrospiraceae bacterium]|nr:MAG: hypothetical protein KatS3mg082_1455 [Nitrospiraceae bacterium]
MSDEERREVHRGFRDGSINVVCATSAFGMGIDRPDVRVVVQVEYPAGLSEYFQMAGRARAAMGFRPTVFSS